MIENLMPVSELKSRAGQILDGVEETGNPVVITQHGKAKAVLVSVDEYQKKERALAMLKILSVGARDFNEGRHKPVDQALNNLRQKVRAARNAKR
jgi:prevent-host-death family protein